MMEAGTECTKDRPPCQHWHVQTPPCLSHLRVQTTRQDLLHSLNTHVQVFDTRYKTTLQIQIWKNFIIHNKCINNCLLVHSNSIHCGYYMVRERQRQRQTDRQSPWISCLTMKYSCLKLYCAKSPTDSALVICIVFYNFWWETNKHCYNSSQILPLRIQLRKI